MSQIQVETSDEHVEGAGEGLGEHKVNPQTLIGHGADEEKMKIGEGSAPVSAALASTPKRNKSEQKSGAPAEKESSHKHSLSLTHSPKTANKHANNAERIPEVEEEGDHKNYEQLTMKLELVLNKIASSSKAMNKSVSQADNIMARFEECEDRKRRQIDRKKEEYEEQKCRELKDKPTIDRNSDKISKEIGHRPIYLRVDALVEEKKKKLERNEELRKKKQEEEEHTYIEEYNKHVRKPDTLRTYDQYFTEMVRWKEKRQQENQQKLEMQKSKELQGITFQPSLNPKSKKMASSHQRLPIEQRGLLKSKKGTEPKEEQKSYKKLAAHQ